MNFCFKNTVANGDSDFGTITGNLNNRKNVPQKMRRYSKYGSELSGDNSRVNCIIPNDIVQDTFEKKLSDFLY
jgi:hypothetical protein